MPTRTFLQRASAALLVVFLVPSVFAQVPAEERWQPLASSGTDGSVNTSTIDAQGRAWIGGSFRFVGGATSPSISFHDGTRWVAADRGLDGPVTAMAAGANPGEVLVGGSFSASGAAPVRGLARWDGTRWREVAGGILRDPGSEALQVRDLAVDPSSGTLYVAGRFRTVSGVTVMGIARHSALTGWQVLPSAPGFAVGRLAWDGVNARLVAGGIPFGGELTGLAVFRSGVWTPVPGPGNAYFAVNDLAVGANGEVIVAAPSGSRSLHRLLPDSRLVAIDVDGEVASVDYDASRGVIVACCGHRTGSSVAPRVLSIQGTTISEVDHPDTRPLARDASVAAGAGRVVVAYISEETINQAPVAGVAELRAGAWHPLASTRRPLYGRVVWSPTLQTAVALGDNALLVLRNGAWSSIALPADDWRSDALSASDDGVAVAGHTGTGGVFAVLWNGQQWMERREAERFVASQVTAVVWQPLSRRFVLTGDISEIDDAGGGAFRGIAWAQSGAWGTFGTGLQRGAGPGPGPGSGRGLTLDPQGRLLVFGGFDRADGQPAAGIARVEASNLVPLRGVAGSDVTALAWSPLGVIAAEPGGAIHRIPETGALETLGSVAGQSSFVGSLVYDLSTETLLASGHFESAGGTAASNLARYRDGVWRSFRGGAADGPIYLDWFAATRTLLAGSVAESTHFGAVPTAAVRGSINRPPTIQMPPRLTAFVFVGDAITPVLASARDEDGDDLDVRHAWCRDGSLIPSATSTTYVATRADRQRPIVFATRFFDGEDIVETRSNPLQVVNRRPSTSPDRIRLEEGAVIDLPSSSVLANDIDRDGDPLTVRAVAAPSGGIFTVQAGGGLRVGGLPAGRFEARYAACDDLELCSEETLALVVRSGLVAYDDTVMVQGQRGSVAIATLANDRFEPSRVAGGALSIESAPSSGAASIDTRGTADAADDRIVYAWTAAPSSGVDAFRYRLCEAGGRCSTAGATVIHRVVGEAGLANEPVSDGGWLDLDLPGLQGLSTIRVDAHGLVVPEVREMAVPLDETPANASDPGSSASLFLEAELRDRSERRRIFVDAVASSAAVLQVDMGVDLDADGIADPGERSCRAVGNAGRTRCEIPLAPVGGSLPFYWVQLRNLDGDDVTVRLEVFDVSVDLPIERRSVVATSGMRPDSGGVLRARLSWRDPTFLQGQSRGGWLSVSAPGRPTIWQPFRWVRAPGAPSPFALRSGVEHSLALAVGGAHERLFIDVVPGTTSLDASAFSTANVDLYLARVDAPAASATTPTIPPAPPRAAAFVAGRTVANEILSIANPQPGRWYVTPVNAGAFDAEVVVTATLTGTGPQLRPGGFYNPQRSGNGLFLYPAGNQWAGLWYTYLQDGTTTWYYLQGEAPGVTGVWRGTIFRSAWNGSSNFLTPIGEATVTPRSTSAFTYSYTLDGETGSEAYESFGGGCPTFAGAPLDASGHWFDPAKAGSGYSVQLFPNYEFYTVFGYDAQGVPRYLVAERSGIGAATQTLSLDQNTGACPLCTRTGNPARATVGTLTRTIGGGTLQRIQLSGTFTAGVPGTWAANDAVIPLGSLQGCAAN